MYMIDLGLAKRYIDRKDKTHIPYRDGKRMLGTIRYSSINTHLGIEQSRRDDLESLGYCFIYFLKGSLPWQNVKAKSKQEKYAQIKNIKIGTSLDVLCKGTPPEFKEYMETVRYMRFDETPNYEGLRNLFYKVLKRHGFVNDYKFDWVGQQLTETTPKE